MDSRNFQFMFYGFTAAWLIVFVYILTLVRRGNRIRAELKRQEALLERPGVVRYLQIAQHRSARGARPVVLPSGKA